MRYALVYLLLTLFLSAEGDKLSLQYTSLSYKNYSTNHLLSLYLDTEHILSFQEGDLELRMGLNALGVIDKSDDMRFFDTVTKNRAIISSLSVDYYPSSQFLLSIGRESMDINLLRGSFDGFLATGELDDFSFKAFYFKHYARLQPTYYKSEKIDKLYGFNLHYEKGVFEGEATYFTYYGHTVNNLYAALHSDTFTLGAEYLAFTSDLLNDEKAYKFLLGYRHENFYAEAGYYHVYEGTLRNIFALGGSEFKNYQLHGFLDQENAKNIYLDLQYNYNDFALGLHAGYTEFEAFWSPLQKYHGKEFGITLSKKYGNFVFSAALLTQKSDQTWDDGERTTWVQTQCAYRF